MSAIDPLAVSDSVTDSYRRYLSSLISPNHSGIAEALTKEISQLANSTGGLVKGPYLEITPAYEQSLSSQDLISLGDLNADFARLDSPNFRLDRPWFTHQVQALRHVNSGRNLMVATGTGSGKTESFLLPILNKLLSDPNRNQPGVRALLLYPMNALANDQLKRLRQMLAAIPEITFGRYTGETENEFVGARERFKQLHPGERILSNELLSREEMRVRPPHILLTNYAMLEYLLLRPEDSELFGDPDAETWKFLVLDEAHSYDGASGAEIGYLVRRLTDRVSRNRTLQSIATSATIGSILVQAAKFGTDLFGASFEAKDIVIATYAKPFERTAWGELPGSAMVPGQTIEKLKDVARRSGAPDASTHEILTGENTIRRLHALALERPLTINEAVARLGRADLTPERITTLVHLASLVTDGAGTPVISAKYHLFARSTEGAFACLNPSGSHVSLTRKEICECGWKMIEFAACRRCGSVHFVGAEEHESGVKRFTPKARFDERTVWLSPADSVLDEIDQDDEVEEFPAGGDFSTNDKKEKPVGFCPKCGRMAISPTGTCAEPGCGMTVQAMHRKAVTELAHCLACGGRTPGIIRRFESGNDAAVSVLATSLYQELPGVTEGDIARLPGEGRKLLVFSDSRQQAAFFAPYIEQSYDRILHRRLLFDAIVRGQFDEEPAQTGDILNELTKAAKASGYFPEHMSRRTRNKWIETWLQGELIATDERISLEGVGLVRWCMSAPRSWQALSPLIELGFTETEVIDIVEILVRTLRIRGAVSALEDVDLSDEYFDPRRGEYFVRGQGSDSKNKIVSWAPTATSRSRHNNRSDYLGRLFEKAGLPVGEVTQTLEGLWSVLTDQTGDFDSWFEVKRPRGLGEGLFALDPDALTAKIVQSGDSVWRCDHCGTTSHFSVRGVCPRYRCPGDLIEIERNDLVEENHYRHLYKSLKAIPLSAKEHTAQWTGTEAAAIQSNFIAGKVNVLSCSTTFELGVDVGELQSVVLKNVPPTVSNYVQRAGRAGRRGDNAALVLTYAQRRSHDLTVFANPPDMIAGRVRTPLVPIRNPRIAERHFFSIAISAYLKWIYPKRIKTANDFFRVDGSQPTSVANDIVPWLHENQEPLDAAVRRVSRTSGLYEQDFAWHVWTAKFGRLLDEVQGEYNEEIDLFERLKDEAFAVEQARRAGYYQSVLRTLKKVALFAYLANNNLIPKYGFPVDTVELRIPENETLELSRDLSRAIFEYAPESQIVAGGKLWTSVAVARRRDRENTQVHFRVCDICGSYIESADVQALDCRVCGTASSSRVRVYMEPRFGFIAAKDPAKPGERAPRSMYRGELQVAHDGTSVETITCQSSGGEIVTEVMERATLVQINSGTTGKGFLICDYCGFGTRESWPKQHPNPSTRRECKGGYSILSLAHRYETDVVRIVFPKPWPEFEIHQIDVGESLKYALLQGSANALQISTSDIDAVVNPYRRTIYIVDSVPGGAGYARLIGSSISAALRGAFDLVHKCACGPETSCYSCLRSSSNQWLHHKLARGPVETYLHGLGINT